jgi:hypothetical protein
LSVGEGRLLLLPQVVAGIALRTGTIKEFFFSSA